MATTSSSKNQELARRLSEYGKRGPKVFGLRVLNLSRINLDAGRIDGVDVDIVEQWLDTYDQKSWFMRLWQRLSSDIEKKRALLCYYYASEYSQAMNSVDEPAHAFWRKTKNIRMARAREKLEKHRLKLSYFSRMRAVLQTVPEMSLPKMSLPKVSRYTQEAERNLQVRLGVVSTAHQFAVDLRNVTLDSNWLFLRTKVYRILRDVSQHLLTRYSDERWQHGSMASSFLGKARNALQPWVDKTINNFARALHSEEPEVLTVVPPEIPLEAASLALVAVPLLEEATPDRAPTHNEFTELSEYPTEEPDLFKFKLEQPNLEGVSNVEWQWLKDAYSYLCFAKKLGQYYLSIEDVDTEDHQKLLSQIESTLKKAYWKLARKYHPDRCMSYIKGVTEEQSKKFFQDIAHIFDCILANIIAHKTIYSEELEDLEQDLKFALGLWEQDDVWKIIEEIARSQKELRERLEKLAESNREIAATFDELWIALEEIKKEREILWAKMEKQLEESKQIRAENRQILADNKQTLAGNRQMLAESGQLKCSANARSQETQELQIASEASLRVKNNLLKAAGELRGESEQRQVTIDEMQIQLKELVMNMEVLWGQTGRKSDVTKVVEPKDSRVIFGSLENSAPSVSHGFFRRVNSAGDVKKSEAATTQVTRSRAGSFSGAVDTGSGKARESGRLSASSGSAPFSSKEKIKFNSSADDGSQEPRKSSSSGSLILGESGDETKVFGSLMSMEVS